jgi:hypothetical protein
MEGSGDAGSPVSSTGSNRLLTLKRAETLAKHVLQVSRWWRACHTGVVYVPRLGTPHFAHP